MTELEIIVGSTASSKAIKNAVNGEASNAGCVLNSRSTTNKIAAQSAAILMIKLIGLKVEQRVMLADQLCKSGYK